MGRLEIKGPGRNVMKTVKLFLVVCLAMLLLVSAVIAQEKTGQMKISEPSLLSKAAFPIEIQAGGYDLVNIIFDFPPGAGFPNHFHGGHAVATVLTAVIVTPEPLTSVFHPAKVYPVRPVVASAP